MIFLPSSGYDCCGVAVSEEDLAALRADMGILRERRWLELEWGMPADEACGRGQLRPFGVLPSGWGEGSPKEILAARNSPV